MSVSTKVNETLKSHALATSMHVFVCIPVEKMCQYCEAVNSSIVIPADLKKQLTGTLSR